MSKFNVGDKVYLKCEVNKKDMRNNTYELKYKARWDDEYTYSATDFVRDDILHAPDEAYNKGLSDAWELAKKIVGSPSNGGYTANELVKIFGIVNEPMLDAYTPQEALAKVKAYTEERNNIKVGDVVTMRGKAIESIVTKVDGYAIYRLYRDGSCGSYTNKEDLVKTGKHFDSIDEFMRSEE